MIIFNTDLDNTLIYSYKHDIGTDTLNVELSNGKEIAFVSGESFRLLNELSQHALIVPTTTRSIEQYKRINLGIGRFPYALVCNGGVLLRDGKVDEEWYHESLEHIKDCKPVMAEAALLLENEPHRYFEVRFIEKLFLFTKCTDAGEVVNKLINELNNDMVDVINNRDKVYVIPKSLNKGSALKRLRKKLNPEMVMAAGDSEFDISMVTAADIGYVPKGFRNTYNVSEASVIETAGDRLFSEELLNMCIEKIAKHK